MLLLLVQLAGGIASAVYVLGDAGFLIQAQLVFQLGLGGLMIRAASLALTRAVRPRVAG